MYIYFKHAIGYLKKLKVAYCSEKDELLDGLFTMM
jgi:hypothetical protein